MRMKSWEDVILLIIGVREMTDLNFGRREAELNRSFMFLEKKTYSLEISS